LIFFILTYLTNNKPLVPIFLAQYTIAAIAAAKEKKKKEKHA